RDGGCQLGDCDRPPSWCETHHIDHWTRDHGSTNTNRGILLCRHHHMLVHNNGWEITRTNGTTHFIPPPDIDPHQKPIRARTKSPALTRLLST
ncbi:MAG TPA: HNH endonuclease signature motif containing protein, partial [Rhodoglobus sp.]|nr:HNH endonuclease signature motif containing protein [Rhodoglobus sp.]